MLAFFPKGVFDLRAAKFVLCVIGGFLVPTSASAIVTNGLPTGVTVSPLPFQEALSSNNSNSDIGNQSPGNVQSALESATWFGTPLTFVGGGACNTSPTCNAFENGTKGGTSNLEANVYGVHYGNNFIAVLYSQVVSGFSIDGLSNGVSNIYAFNSGVSPIPVPAALPLFLTALAALGLGGWWRRRGSLV